MFRLIQHFLVAIIQTLFLCNQRNVQESTIKYIEYSCPNPQLHDKLTKTRQNEEGN